MPSPFNSLLRGLVNTGTIILTFDRCTLPTNVKIGWKSYEVREYIPTLILYCQIRLSSRLLKTSPLKIYLALVILEIL